MFGEIGDNGNLSDAAKRIMNEVEGGETEEGRINNPQNCDDVSGLENVKIEDGSKASQLEKDIDKKVESYDTKYTPDIDSALGITEMKGECVEKAFDDASNSTLSSSTTLSLNSKLMKEEEETFYSAEGNEHGDDDIWGLLSGVAGNIYEWYDFAVYGLLSSEIGANFFPTSSKELQLINSFGVFLAAFIMRPIGAVMFGEIGDRLCGRKHALVASIILITIPSILMGLLPSYYVIGNAAPILLLILRMIQGLSVGGQLAGSYVLSIEQSTSRNRGFRGSICDASSVGGFVLASLVTTIVRNSMTDEYAMEDWGWRVPFLLTLLFSPILYMIVSRSEESKFWSERNDQKETEKAIREVQHVEQTPAVKDLLKSPFRRRQLMAMIFVMSVMTSSFYVLFVWTPVYLSELRGIVDNETADIYNLATVTCHIFFLLISGKISDSFPHRQDLLKFGIIAVIFVAPIMFGMFESESQTGYLIAQLQYALCLSFIQGGIAAWEVELWMADPTLSFTGVAMGHNLAACFFGGSTPLFCTLLYYVSIDISDDFYSSTDLFFRVIPGLYISILGCLALFCLKFVIRHPHDVRTGEKEMRQARANQKRRRKREMKRVLKEIGTSGILSPASTFGMESARGEAQKKSYNPPALKFS